MGKGRNFLEQLALSSEIGTEAISGQPMVEISGDRRVLIENHFGVKAYNRESIVVNVKYGCICVCGCGLELMRMTR